MRLGLIGLGRIGAFHATNLSRLTQVESLVVYRRSASTGRVGCPASWG